MRTIAASGADAASRIAAARSRKPAAPGTLNVTVVDPSGAVIVGATVTVTGAEDADARRLDLRRCRPEDAGIATVAGLPPGRYTIQAEFPGFETRIAAGRPRAERREQAGRRARRFRSSKPRSPSGRTSRRPPSDPHGQSFGTVLTREEIEALSDDPTILQQQLNDMAGPGAVIKIDGFEGAALPAKAQIRSIRISRDQFAAENHSAGGVSIEIITQPGLGPIRYNTNLRDARRRAEPRAIRSCR